MEQILTKIEKRYGMGFVLTDKELKKIELLILYSLKKLGIESINWSIVVRLKNGALLLLASVDEVLSLENEDDQEVTGLYILTGDDENYSIEINFDAFPIKDSGQLLNTSPVTVSVIGRSKDWARITWIEIQERLKKIQRKSISLGVIFENAWSLMIWLGVITFFIWIFFDISAQNKNTYIEASEVIQRLDELAKSQSVNSVQEFKDLYITVEKEKQQILNIKNNSNAPKPIDKIADFKSNVRRWSIAILIVLLVAYLFYFFWHRPNYNFVWGEYKDAFEKIEKKRSTSLNIVIAVIILGILVNISSSFIYEYWLK